MLGPLHELIVYVADMERQVRFYRDTLGFDVRYPAGLDSYADQFWVVFETGPCALALHGGREGEAGAYAPKFVFRVDDITSARDRLAAAGVPVSDVRSPAPGVQVVDCTDPEGNAFSIESGG